MLKDKIEEKINLKGKKNDSSLSRLSCQICNLVVISGNSVKIKLNKIMKLNHQTTQIYREKIK
jgi:hypothetical protein